MGAALSRRHAVRRRVGRSESRGRARPWRAARHRRPEPQDPHSRRVESRVGGGHARRRVRLQPDARVPRAEMTAVREAIGLPVLFLTVLLLGGIRIGDTIALLEPSVFALVLGLLLLRVLVQSGALAPERLMSPSRSALANLNGFVVLMALWAAAGQTIALLIPESGLPRLIANVFFLVMLVNTAAAAPDRLRLLRSLTVPFGAA